MKQNAIIDLTVTGSCNKRCSYCFENGHICRNDPEIRRRELNLLEEYCGNFDKDRFNNLLFSFWGGEPLMDVDFMFDVMDVLGKYDFVRYAVYSNGTLVNNWRRFLSDERVWSIKDRFQV